MTIDNLLNGVKRHLGESAPAPLVYITITAAIIAGYLAGILFSQPEKITQKDITGDSIADIAVVSGSNWIQPDEGKVYFIDDGKESFTRTDPIEHDGLKYLAGPSGERWVWNGKFYERIGKQK